MNKIWQIKNPNPKLQKEFSDALGIHPIIAQLLVNRNITDIQSARDFLSDDIGKLHDPFLLKDMDRVVKRIKKCAKHKERVMVFGDYDVDGVASSTILNRALSEMGIEVVHHIPHRFNDGYGLNHNVALIAKEKDVSVLIAIDCGITAIDEVESIKKQGIDVIVVDHHEPNEEQLPKAFAIINPKQKDCDYPFKELASVGLAAKLAHALLGRVSEDTLDLVAIGTIADVAPLRGENRILVKAGLPKVNSTKNKGLSALMEVAKVDTSKKINPFHVGFILGPRINAAGRMDSAHGSLDLFLSDDSQEAYNLARILDKHNTNRQKMQRDIVREALEIVEQEVNFKDEKVIVLSKEGWHKGVLGIVASQITDKYYRPSIVISVKDGVGTASARSINGFHIQKALKDCSDCLENFGGHGGAAGLTIKEENIDLFRNLINKIAQNAIETEHLIPLLSIDSEIALSHIDLELAQIIESLEPFGEGNPNPTFCSRKIAVKGRPAILGRDTLKFWVTDQKKTISAVGFRMAEYKGMICSGQPIDLAYQITIDDWNKAPTPQLKIKDIKLSEVEGEG